MQESPYIKVILPLRLEWEPCYYCPHASIGDRVKVSFASRNYIGVVSGAGITPDIGDKNILPASPCGLERITEAELELWRFIASYYMCTLGEVYKAAYPSRRTVSEQTGVRVAERAELVNERTRQLLLKRIERLSERLAAKDKALAGKHNDIVRERLQEQRNAIARELSRAQASLQSTDKTKLLDFPSASTFHGTTAEPGVLGGKSEQLLKSSKPLLLVAGQRTEEYLYAASKVLAQGRNVLFLVPEIRLAQDLESSLRASFGDCLLVHHSRLSQPSRRKITDKIREGARYVLLGTRSSLFLPHNDLGLIIVDEEQDVYYKQDDPSPRYNARDCAVFLSRIHRCPVILGTSSPSLESLHNAISGKYCLLQGKDGSVSVPEIIDTTAERKKNGMSGALSFKLIGILREMSGKDRDVSAAVIRGFEKEDELRAQLSGAGLDALSFDIISIPEASYRDFEEYDIVVLTSADALFHDEDFRSDEKALQFLDRLSHRCNSLVIQTGNAGRQVFSSSESKALLAERKEFSLPPFTRMIDVRLEDKSEKRLAFISTRLSGLLGREFPGKVMGPVQLSEERTLFRLVFDKDRMLPENKSKLASCIKEFEKEKRYTGHIGIDVDPL